MHPKSGFKPNSFHIALEILGTVLAGIGLAEALAHTNLVPIQFRFENYGWYMAGLGMLLGIPHLTDLFKHAKANSNN